MGKLSAAATFAAFLSLGITAMGFMQEYGLPDWLGYVVFALIVLGNIDIPIKIWRSW